VSFGT